MTRKNVCRQLANRETETIQVKSAFARKEIDKRHGHFFWSLEPVLPNREIAKGKNLQINYSQSVAKKSEGVKEGEIVMLK